MSTFLGQSSVAPTRWLLLLGLALSGGCQQPVSDSDEPSASQAAEPAMQIAFCNLDEVAQELGLRQQMDRILASRQSQLNAQVQQIQKQAQEAVNKKSEEIGEDADEEQKKQLARLQLEAMQSIRNAQSAANKVLSRERTSLIQQIRTKIKVPIDTVAKEKGINIVVTQHPDFLVYAAGAADITSDVVSAARAAEMGVLEPESTPPDDSTDTNAGKSSDDVTDDSLKKDQGD